MVVEKVLNMIASSTIPAIGLRRSPGRMHPAASASSSTSPNSETSGSKARAASVGWLVSSCWAKSTITQVVDSGSTGLARQRRTAQPVVLDHEPVDALQRVGLLVDLLAEELRRRAHGLLEQGQQQLVLAAEVLVEEAQRLTGALDHLVHGEVAPRLALVHQLEGGVEEPLQAVLRPGPGREQRPRHGLLTPAQRLLPADGLLDVEVTFGHRRRVYLRWRKRRIPGRDTPIPPAATLR